MKRFLLSFVAVVGLLATSCVQDATNDMELNKQGVVTFAVDAQHTSRAYGVAAEANDLYYAVYQNGQLLDAISVLPGEEPIGLINGAANISLSLATGLEYEFVFWAASEDAISKGLYSFDWANKTMTLNADKLVASDESLDAFYKYDKFTVEGTATHPMTLKRPFAQINVATGDTENAANAGLTVAETWFEVSGAYNTLNLATGIAEDSTTLTYDAAAKTGEKITANNKQYDLLGVIYVLANKDESPLNNVKFSYNRNAGEATAVKTIEVPSAPIKRNARTNLVGNILTSNNGFDVDIDEDFEDDINKDIHTTDYYITATYEITSVNLDTYLFNGNITESSNRLVSINYGDGTFGKENNHTYAAAGRYTVKLYFEKPITEIAQSSFSSSRIHSITIPKDVTKIGNIAFHNSNLASISFEKESKLTTIEQGAFVYCRNLKSICLPISVTEIGDCVFAGCYSLESINGGARGFSTALGVFYKWLGSIDCHVIAYPASLNLEIVSYAPNHHNIGWGAFVGCKYLKELDIIISKIYQYNFMECEQLEYIRLDQTTYIENDVIKGCPKLKEINLPIAREIGGNCFINNESLTSINLGCDELKTISAVGNNNISLSTLWIPSGVTEISESFNRCAAISEVYCKATTPPALVNSFDAIPATAKIYVPSTSKEAYKTAEGWSQHADNIEGYDF